MARVDADLVIKQRKTYKQVPDKLKPQVKQALIDCGREDLIGEE